MSLNDIKQTDKKHLTRGQCLLALSCHQALITIHVHALHLHAEKVEISGNDVKETNFIYNFCWPRNKFLPILLLGDHG